ncbi:MAG: NAD(P)/FAD-dependent oxidoreductase, partial [Novosphingobium sp.]
THWGKAAFREAALFTHKGLSGPAMLQISSYWQHRTAIGVEFLPDAANDWLIEEKRARPRSGFRTALSRRLPERLAEALAERIGLDGELVTLRDADLRGAVLVGANLEG